MILGRSAASWAPFSLNINFKEKNMDEQTSIKEYAARKRREYKQKYSEANPEKVAQWRKNAIVNAYKRLIAAEPKYKV